MHAMTRSYSRDGDRLGDDPAPPELAALLTHRQQGCTASDVREQRGATVTLIRCRSCGAQRLLQLDKRGRRQNR